MLYKSVESTNGAHHYHHRHLMMIIIIIVIIIINIVIVVVSVAAADDAAAADIIIMSSSRIISGSSNIIIFASSLFKCREASGILPCERYSVDRDRTECDLISPERYRPRYIVEQKGKKRGSAATHDLVARKG